MKMLDFGLAKLTQADSSTPDGATVTLEEQTHPGQILGTVCYMSPEQVRGSVADYRADIFAFGAILYEMLTGKRGIPQADITRNNDRHSERGVMANISTLRPEVRNLAHSACASQTARLKRSPA